MVEAVVVIVILTLMPFVLLRWYFFATHKQSDSLTNLIRADQCSVIIPFRNEAQSLPRLLRCLERQVVYPAEIIFVNDHSTDDSLSILEEWSKEKNNVTVESLPRFLKGKKQGVHRAMQLASFPYCLTMDADVWMNNTFFDSLSVNSEVDLQIRPVLMVSQSILGKMAAIEYQFFNAFSYWVNPFYTLSASGANLLVKRETYFEGGGFDVHQHIASGDDYFLLRNFQKNNAGIAHSIQNQDIVYTPAPKGVRDYLNQRVRWLRKSRTVFDWRESFLGVLIISYLLGTFVLFVLSLIKSNYGAGLIIFGIRLVTDALVLIHFRKQFKDYGYWWLIPLMQIIYPLLFLVVLIVSSFYDPPWKGRRINAKN